MKLTAQLHFILEKIKVENNQSEIKFLLGIIIVYYQKEKADKFIMIQILLP